MAAAKAPRMPAPRSYRNHEEHALLMRSRSKTLKRRATYMANTTPAQRKAIARNAWEHRGK
jgi:hypothetical protein